MPHAPVWWLYLIECDAQLYTGITTDLQRRLHEHHAGRSRAARFTRGAGRITLRYAVGIGSRGLALRAEYRFRRLPRREKIAIIEAQPPRDDLLTRLLLQSPPSPRE